MYAGKSYSESHHTLFKILIITKVTQVKVYSKCRGYTCIQTKDDKPCTINNSSGP